MSSPHLTHCRISRTQNKLDFFLGIQVIVFIFKSKLHFRMIVFCAEQRVGKSEIQATFPVKV